MTHSSAKFAPVPATGSVCLWVGSRTCMSHDTCSGHIISRTRKRIGLGSWAPASCLPCQLQQAAWQVIYMPLEQLCFRSGNHPRCRSSCVEPPKSNMPKQELPVTLDIVREKNLEQLKLLSSVIFPVKYAVRQPATRARQRDWIALAQESIQTAVRSWISQLTLWCILLRAGRALPAMHGMWGGYAAG